MGDTERSALLVELPHGHLQIELLFVAHRPVVVGVAATFWRASGAGHRSPRGRGIRECNSFASLARQSVWQPIDAVTT
ncbi:MAG: hypothetical protein KDI72_03570 [Xanthomonadales bacterium]|nr:hypothetical protein [Xanthomonadales bacterium]